MEFKPTKVGPLLPFLYKFTLKTKYRQGRKARCSTCRSWVALRAQVGLARGHTGTLREPLWRDLICAPLATDMDAAMAAKGATENALQALSMPRASSSSAITDRRPVSWPLLFELEIIICRLPEDPQEATAALQAWIWSGPPESGATTMTTTADH